jgi:hypothetical protein
MMTHHKEIGCIFASGVMTQVRHTCKLIDSKRASFSCAGYLNAIARLGWCCVDHNVSLAAKSSTLITNQSQRIAHSCVVFLMVSLVHMSRTSSIVLTVLYR